MIAARVVASNAVEGAQVVVRRAAEIAAVATSLAERHSQAQAQARQVRSAVAQAAVPFDGPAVVRFGGGLPDSGRLRFLGGRMEELIEDACLGKYLFIRSGKTRNDAPVYVLEGDAEEATQNLGSFYIHTSWQLVLVYSGHSWSLQAEEERVNSTDFLGSRIRSRSSKTIVYREPLAPRIGADGSGVDDTLISRDRVSPTAAEGVTRWCIFDNAMYDRGLDETDPAPKLKLVDALPWAWRSGHGGSD